jgi:hypothetical protein
MGELTIQISPYSGRQSHWANCRIGGNSVAFLILHEVKSLSKVTIIELDIFIMKLRIKEQGDAHLMKRRHSTSLVWEIVSCGRLEINTSF